MEVLRRPCDSLVTQPMVRGQWRGARFPPVEVTALEGERLLGLTNALLACRTVGMGAAVGGGAGYAHAGHPAPMQRRQEAPVASALKFSAVLGTVLPYSPITILPAGAPSISMSKNTWPSRRSRLKSNVYGGPTTPQDNCRHGI